MKVQILLINTPFKWNDGVSYFSWIIRKVTGSFWNHLAVRYTSVYGDYVIQATGKGVYIQTYEEFLSAGDRWVLPREVTGDFDLNAVLKCTDRMYGYFDVILVGIKILVNRFISKDWKGWNNKRGMLCTELGGIGFGIKYLTHPAEYEFMQGMISLAEYKTYKNNQIKTLA